MQSRSAKSLRGRCANRFFRDCRTSYVLAAVAAAGLSISDAGAVSITVAANPPYGISSGVVWFHNDDATSVDTASDASPNGGFKSVPSNVDTGDTGLLEFKVESAETTLTTNAVITVSLPRSPSDLTYFNIPIATVTDSSGTRFSCSDTLCRAPSGTPTRYYGANAPKGDPITVGVYLKSVCEAVNANGGTLDACTGAIVKTPVVPNVPLSFPLRFAVSNAVDGAVGSNGAAPTAEELMVVTAKLVAGGPGIGPCPNLTSFYFPGDSQILVEPGILAPFAVPSPAAPATDTLLVAIRKANATLPTYASNDRIARLSLAGGSQTIDGLVNATSPSDSTNVYTLNFGIRDQSGALTSFGCGATGIRTSAIEGYLRESKCFIATAAYGSGNAWGVMLLRRFRDRILLKTGLGVEFVDWYYSWSPGAAHWLILNPEFRWIVLAALVPLQFIAWLLLNPPVLGASALFGMGYWIASRRKP